MQIKALYKHSTLMGRVDTVTMVGAIAMQYASYCDHNKQCNHSNHSNHCTVTIVTILTIVPKILHIYIILENKHFCTFLFDKIQM